MSNSPITRAYQVILDRILSLEYNSDMDKLFFLATKKPVRSSAIALCVLDVEKDIDTLLDTGKYVFHDENGDPFNVRPVMSVARENLNL